jgi:undecaprenyl-diphosphatase
VSPFQAAVLGIVQGLTEFLPISSSGHLLLVPFLFGWAPHGLAFDAALHLGTAAALLAYFWRDWLSLARAALVGLGDPKARLDPHWRLFWLLIVGSIPAGVVGLLLESTIESAVRQPWLVGLLLIAFGLLMLVVDRAASLARGLERVGLGDAVAVGLAQCLALVPGVSRSGITITAGLLRGLDRAAAARFSFLLSTPITVAAALYSLRKLTGPGAASSDLLALLVGVLAAAVSGWLAIGFLLRFLQRNSLAVFVVYRVLAGLLVLGLSLAGFGG